MRTYKADESFITLLAVKFPSPIEYLISHCANKPELPVQPPDQVAKIWTFRKSTTAIIIECNGVEVLNYKFSDSSDSRCVTKWEGDKVDEIKFTSYDTASDGYRAKQTGNDRVIYVNHRVNRVMCHACSLHI